MKGIAVVLPMVFALTFGVFAQESSQETFLRLAQRSDTNITIMWPLQTEFDDGTIKGSNWGGYTWADMYLIESFEDSSDAHFFIRIKPKHDPMKYLGEGLYHFVLIREGRLGVEPWVFTKGGGTQNNGTFMDGIYIIMNLEKARFPKDAVNINLEITFDHRNKSRIWVSEILHVDID